MILIKCKINIEIFSWKTISKKKNEKLFVILSNHGETNTKFINHINKSVEFKLFSKISLLQNTLLVQLEQINFYDTLSIIAIKEIIAIFSSASRRSED